MNPKLTGRNLKFFVILILLSLFTISQVQSQSVNINDYATKYNVKPGDSMQYKYSRIIVPGFNYINYSIPQLNGPVQNVKITQGTLLTITIANVSTTPYMSVHANETILTPNGKTYHLNDITGNYVLRSFDNRSIVNSFVNALNNQSKSNPNQHYSCDNTFLYLNSFNSYPANYLNNQNVNITNSYDFVFNWHSGWLKSQDFTTKYTNGTIISSIRFEQATTNLLDQAINTGMNLTILIFPIMIIAAVGLAFISYKKNISKNSNNINNSSFSHYLTTNFKKQRQKPRTKQLQIDKSLEIIDDILRDSENG